MKIRVESFFDGWVRFTSEIGEGEARWSGGEPFPGEYSVELELEAPVEVTPALAQVPLFEATRDGCRLRGQVIAVVAGISTVAVGPARIHIEGALAGWVAVRSGPLVLFDEKL